MAASLGTFDLSFDSGIFVEPGSDSGWNRVFDITQERELGEPTDFILNMSSGSARRNFTLRMTQAQFEDMQDTTLNQTLDFEDWDGEIMSVYVFSVARQRGSRPWRVIVDVELVEV